MNHRSFIVTLSASLCLLSACGRETETDSPPPPGPSGWPATQATDKGSFEATIKPTVEEITRNDHFSLDVTVTAKKGEGDIKVVVDADMPAHQHGMNTKPETSAKGDGKYRVDGMALHMAGDWVITVDVTRGSATERATFPVSVE